jgi:predicted DCC family thiol-disulfide oxidoreductase YuxK
MRQPDLNTRIIIFDGICHVCSGWVRFWRMSNVAHILPKSWRDSLYRLLARNRYRWFGRRSTCCVAGS